MDYFPEILEAAKHNKNDIKIFSENAKKGVESNNGKLPDVLFKLKQLHQLTVTDVKLTELSDDIRQLNQLHSLLLYSNQLTQINPYIFSITGMKVLDLSRNKVESVPIAITALTNLTHLNLSQNNIGQFPTENEIMIMPQLQCLDLSHNQLIEFPKVCTGENVHLADLLLGRNQIEEIASDINQLPVLKNLDLSDNKLKRIPLEVAEITKLKEINLKNNSLDDNRLKKLIVQCRTKQIIDYIKQHSTKGNSLSVSNEGSGKGKKNKKGKGNSNKSNDQNIENAVDDLCNRINVLHTQDEIFNVKISEDVKSVRPHIVCCVVHGLNFTEESFKKFIQLQTKLHDSICEKRNAATIATHDLAKLQPGDLLYTARLPQRIQIQPLSRNKVYTGQELFLQLQNEAEALRKEKKRNVYSGVHKYLYLLDGKKFFPCLMDSKNQVISFPPITNSEITKMSFESKSMFVEVTSAQNQTVCRKVMDAFLFELINLGVGNVIENNETDENKFYNLDVQQIKIVDLIGEMRVVYPSKVDLVTESNNNIKIVRS